MFCYQWFIDLYLYVSDTGNSKILENLKSDKEITLLYGLCRKVEKKEEEEECILNPESLKLLEELSKECDLRIHPHYNTETAGKEDAHKQRKQSNAKIENLLKQIKLLMQQENTSNNNAILKILPLADLKQERTRKIKPKKSEVEEDKEISLPPQGLQVIDKKQTSGDKVLVMKHLEYFRKTIKLLFPVVCKLDSNNPNSISFASWNKFLGILNLIPSYVTNIKSTSILRKVMSQSLSNIDQFTEIIAYTVIMCGFNGTTVEEHFCHFIYILSQQLIESQILAKLKITVF